MQAHSILSSEPEAQTGVLERPRPPTSLSKQELENLFKIDLLWQILPAMKSKLAENDFRRLYLDRLRSNVTPTDIATWVLHEFGDADLPTWRVGFAVSIGQSLHGFRESNLSDREHAAQLPHVHRFITRDRNFANVLGHPKLQKWIPGRWRLLQSHNGDEEMRALRLLACS